MVPKIIHCCWFGGLKTKLARKCRTSWEKFAPDWEIREWTAAEVARCCHELPGYGFFTAAVAARRWAMASDWLRMAALYTTGGVYFDFDVELLASPEGLADGSQWVASEWTAAGGIWMNPGSGIALEKGSGIAWRMLQAYERDGFAAERDMMPWINEQLGRSVSKDGESLVVLPPEVLSPIDLNGRMHCTDVTRGIHRYAMSDSGWKRRFARWLSWHGLHGVVRFLVWVKRGGR